MLHFIKTLRMAFKIRQKNKASVFMLLENSYKYLASSEYQSNLAHIPKLNMQKKIVPNEMS